MHNAAAKAIDWSEQGLVPDSVIRHGIKRLLKKRIEELHTDDCQTLAERKADFIHAMHASAIAPLPFRANEQHYEVPTEFFSRYSEARVNTAAATGTMELTILMPLKPGHCWRPVNTQDWKTASTSSNSGAAGVR